MIELRTNNEPTTLGCVAVVQDFAGHVPSTGRQTAENGLPVIRRASDALRGSWSVAGIVLDASRVALLGALIGLFSALLANGFVAAILWLDDRLFAPLSETISSSGGSLAYLSSALIPMLAGVVVALLYYFLPENRPQSPADLIAMVQTRQGKLHTRPALATGFASLVSLGGGASVGQYGPLVHLGGMLGSWWARAFRMDVSLGNIAIACGVAGAISSVFNAPIAGILFAHEVLLRHFSVRAFAPIAVASLMGYVSANTFFPQPPLFQIDYAPAPQVWEYGLFVILGVLSALVAVIYMRSILWATSEARRLSMPPIFRIPIAGLLLGIVALWVPEILGIGLDTLRALFSDENPYGAGHLTLLLMLKIVATAWCLGMGFVGGVFSPALLIGSLFGSLFYTVMALIPGITPTALVEYAVCGMMAVTAPVIGAPLTAVVIVFELTGNYQVTIAATASVALANLVSSRIFGRSLFDHQLRQRGIDLSGGRSRALLASRTVSDLIETERGLVVRTSATVGDALGSMAEQGAPEAYLVDPQNRYIGTVRQQALINQSGEGAIDRHLQKPDPAVRGDANLWEAMHGLRGTAGERVPVVGADGTWLGTISVSNLVQSYLQLLAEIRAEEHGGSR